jgi:tetratricopeptide (TPR) repeat protein
LLGSLALLLLPALPGCLLPADERVQQFSEEGVYLYQRGEYQNARECFEVALQLQPADANLMYNVGQCYDSQGKTDKAVEYYQLCLSRSGNHARCRHSLALLLFRTGKAADAERMIQDWLAAEPKSPDALVEDGWRLRQEGDLQHAEGRFQQALHYDPHHVRALTELGILFESVEMPERALVLYERALDRDPRQAELVGRVNALRARRVGKPKPD